MSLFEVVDDLLTLDELAEHEDGPDRRRALGTVRSHLARRERGAKVSEVAQVLGVSQPTVRAWIDAGVLEPIAEATPVRVELLSLADVKRALDLIRRHADRQLLVGVMHVLRDREALVGSDEGFADLRAGRVTKLDRAKLDEMLAPTRKALRRSTSG